MTTSLPPTISAYEVVSTRSPELPRGTPVGRYLVLERIGQGGMGVVYKAYDPDLERNIALKLVRTDSRNPDHRQRLRARLVREAQTLAQLAHPNVITVHDVGTHDDSVFVAMELVDGATLTEVLASERPTLARTIELFSAAARGLAVAHDVSIIHRDFKPDNVIVGRDGRVRVLDFGLARAIQGEPDDGPGDARATQSHVVVGTPAYMAPEQREGLELDARADQYSFCVALYEALFGQRPGEEVTSVPSRTRAGVRVPGRLRAALLRGLALAPDARHPSMHALLGELTLHPRRWWIAGGAAVAVLGAVLALRPAQVDPGAGCDHLDARLTGVWDASRRAAVGGALRRHGDEVSAATVERLLDRYTQAWVAMHTSSCRATHVLGEQSTELLDLRTQCLDRRLAEVRYLTDLFLVASPATAIRAVASVHALEPLDDCANTIALRDPIPPRDPVRARPMRDRLARLRAQLYVGQYAEVMRDAPGLVSDAASVGDRWLEASATYLSARGMRELGQVPRAEDALYRAIAVAETGRASDVVVDAWMALALIAAEDRDRYADALRLAGVAGGVLERLGGNPRLEAALEDHLGLLHMDRHEVDEARRHLERGLALREKLYGKTDDEYARSLHHLAYLEESIGHYDQQLALLRQARAIAEAELGPRHPDVLAMLSAEGGALFRLERHAEAVTLLRAGLPLAEQVSGPRSELVASFLGNLGLAYWRLGESADAQAAFERSFAIHAEHGGADTFQAASIDLNLAFLALDTGALDAARRHAEHAVAVYSKVLGANDPDRAQALEALATAELRSGHPGRAVPSLERAVAIRAAAPNMPANDLAATRFDLAKAIIAARGSTATARKLAEDARDALQGIGDADGVREVSGWLASLP